MCLKLGFTERKNLKALKFFLSALESDFSVLSDRITVSHKLVRRPQRREGNDFGEEDVLSGT